MADWNSDAHKLFLDAVDIVDPVQREEFVKNQCQGDATLEEEVRSLLEANADAADYFSQATGAMQKTPASDSLRGKTGDIIGRYKLLQAIGEGGFGVVYMAEQQSGVKRQVALKVIKPGMDTQEVIARFDAERQALALMDHPNIARVFDAGETDDGRPYFVMELVKGVPITEFCDKQNLNTRERLELFAIVCSAIQHAHQKGVIHRDIKPANVMVTSHETDFVPKVIDFGIAKAISQRLTEQTLFTRFGQIVGTAQYMSPEQAEMTGNDIDTRSDVYSLGVLLYELLTSTTPLESSRIREAGLKEMLRLIVEEDAPRPSQRLSSIGDEIELIAKKRQSDPAKLCRAVRRELDWIVMKALEKDRRRRYNGVNDLGDDVRRYLSGDNVEAVAPTAAYRFRKFVSKNLGYVATGALLLVVLCLATAVSIRHALIAQSAQASEATQRKLAEESAVELKVVTEKQRQQIYALDMLKADQFLKNGTVATVRRLLRKHCPATELESDLRGFEWKYLWHASQSDAIQSFPALGSEVVASLDGRFVAYPTAKSICVREQQPPWKLLRELKTAMPVSHLSFSPGGSLLAAATDDEVTVYQTSTWDTEKSFREASYPIKFSPDGKRLFYRRTSLADVDQLVLMEVESWGEEQVFDTRAPVIGWWLSRDNVEFSADGNRLFYPPNGSDPSQRLQCVRIDERRADEKLSTFLPYFGAVSASPDGRHVAMVDAGRDNRAIEIWDLVKRTRIATLDGHISYVSRLEYSPKGDYLLSTGGDRTVIAWETDGYVKSRQFNGSEREIWGLSVSADSKHVFSANLGDRNGSVKVWRMNQVPAASNSAKSVPLGFLSDGRLVTVEYEGQVRAWSDRDPEMLVKIGAGCINLNPDAVLAASLTVDDRLFFGNSDGQLEAWDIPAKQVTRKDMPNRDIIISVGAHPTRADIALIGTESGTLHIWDFEMQEAIQSINQLGPVVRMRFSADGERVAVIAHGAAGALDSELHVYDFTQGSLQPRFSISSRCTAASFSPDGAYLAVGGQGLTLFDVETGEKVVHLSDNLAALGDVAFTPDGKTLASACHDNTVTLWNVPTWMQMATLDSPNFPSIFFHPKDPNRLVIGSTARVPFKRVQVPSLAEIDAQIDQLVAVDSN